MQGNKEVTALEFIALTKDLPRPHRRSPRFSKVPENVDQNKRMSPQFEEKRVQERRNSGSALLDRIATVEPAAVTGRGRRNSVLLPDENLPKQKDQQLTEALTKWKSMKLVKDPSPRVHKLLKNTLTLIESCHAMGIIQFSNPDKPNEIGITYSLLSIMEAIYKCPAVQRILERDLSIRSHFCIVNFVIRDYQSLIAEAKTILQLIKKNHDLLERILSHLGKQQAEAIDEFDFVPFVRGLAQTSNAQEIFKSGIIKEKDIPLFYQRLGMKKFIALDNEVAKVKMIDMILHPDSLEIIYAPIAIPIKNIISKEALIPLNHLIETLEQMEYRLDMYSDEELEVSINLAINPMGKIKERFQAVLEDLINRLIKSRSALEQIRYRDLLNRVFPPAQLGRQKNWKKAFEMLQDLSAKLK